MDNQKGTLEEERIARYSETLLVAVYTAKLNLSPRRPWGELSPEQEEIVCLFVRTFGMNNL